MDDARLFTMFQIPRTRSSLDAIKYRRVGVGEIVDEAEGISQGIIHERIPGYNAGQIRGVLQGVIGPRGAIDDQGTVLARQERIQRGWIRVQDADAIECVWGRIEACKDLEGIGQ